MWLFQLNFLEIVWVPKLLPKHYHCQSTTENTVNGCCMGCGCHKIEHCERDLFAITWTNLASTNFHFPHCSVFSISYLRKTFIFQFKKWMFFTFSVLKMSPLKVFHVSAYATIMKDRIACLQGCNHLNTSICYSNKNPVRRQLQSQFYFCAELKDR